MVNLTYNKYLRRIEHLIKILTPNAHSYENYGQKELGKFNDKVNADDKLSYAEKATLSSILSERINNLTPSK